MMLGRLLSRFAVLEGRSFSYEYGSGLQLAMDLLEERKQITNKFL
jgi:hypothetical protein